VRTALTITERVTHRSYRAGVSRRSIERQVWPALEEAGFELLAPHAAWRHWHGGVDAVHVLWERDDAFRLVTGVQFDAVPHRQRLRGGRSAPLDGDLHVVRAYAPGATYADALDRELWLAGDDRGALLGELRGKARRAARSLEVLHDPARAVAELAHRTRWEPRPGTTGWFEVTGYLAAAAGAYEVARPRLQRLLRELPPSQARRAQRVRSALTLLP
jgi:hypothetical protein